MLLSTGDGRAGAKGEEGQQEKAAASGWVRLRNDGAQGGSQTATRPS